MPITLPPLDSRPLTGVERVATLDRVDEILELTYRSAGLGNFPDPLEETIYILLSRQTQEIGYQRAHRALRERWPTWHGVPGLDGLAALAPDWIRAGARLVGGCCRVGPGQIAALARATGN